MNVRADNERLYLEEENIMKTISNQKNQRNLNPSQVEGKEERLHQKREEKP